jgi:dTDP-4-amino-4,6-dideoxygalactose transaminase
MTLGVKAGDEVVTTAYSFFATAGVVARLGAVPVFVDVDPTTYNIDPTRLAGAVTPRTRAILPVHLFGLSADMDPILDEASRSGVPVVEDAAQAIGASYKWRPVGTFGAFGCFSFYPTKNLGAFGDAGLLVTNDRALAARARQLRVHGSQGRYEHVDVGGNFRMDALQAAVLGVKAPHLAAWTEARRLNASRYTRMFHEAGLAGDIVLPIEPQGYRHTFNQFVVRLPARDAARARLAERGIGSEVYYPIPFHRQPCFANLGYKVGDFPHAERAAAETLAIPVYGELTLAQQRAVVDAIVEHVRSESPSSAPTVAS